MTSSSAEQLNAALLRARIAEQRQIALMAKNAEQQTALTFMQKTGSLLRASTAALTAAENDKQQFVTKTGDRKISLKPITAGLFSGNSNHTAETAARTAAPAA